MTPGQAYELARSLGIRFDSQKTSGFIPCFRPLSDESHASATFCPEAGLLWDFKDGTRSNLPALMVEVGKASGFCQAVDEIGDIVLGRIA